jgi:phospholipase C
MVVSIVRRRWLVLACLLAVGATLVAACGTSTSQPTGYGTNTDNVGIHKIKHVVIIMQENRSLQRFPLGTTATTRCFPALAGLR